MIARKAVLAIAAGAVLALSGAVQGASDDLSYVNPELRQVARGIARAQATAEGSLALSQPPASFPPLPSRIVERQIPGMAGQPPVTVYIVDPGQPGAARHGAILFIHGGGFIAGDARESLRMLQGMAARLECVIVSVQYRIAPATRFPGSLEDNYAALKWLHDDAATLGVDPARIAVVGESAGGGHAAMLTIAARDRGEIPIVFQALIYPMLDDRTGSSRPVIPTIGTLVWRPADNRKGWSALLGQPAGQRRVPNGSVPARVADLSRLPPTWIGVGSIDLFAQEDIDFAGRLVGAGVPTELLVIPGAFHGFQMIMPKAAISQQFNGALEAALARALSPEKKP
jgi:acetyl esterase/lipase